MRDDKNSNVNRRAVLRTIGASVAVGGAGMSVFAGSAAAWSQQNVKFNGCSQARLVVGTEDIEHDPPAVVRVVVALPDGSSECRDVELTEENTTRIPGLYGDDPVRKVPVEDDEKVLGVIFYNYREDRFSSASCIFTNDHRCAQTPNTPDMESVPCVEAARESGGYDCEDM